MRIFSVIPCMILAGSALAQNSHYLRINAPVGTKVNLKLVTKMVAQTQKGEMGFEATMNQVLTKKSASELEWRTSFRVLSKYGRAVFAGSERSFMDLDGTVMDMIMAPTGVMKKVRMGDIEVPSAGTPSVVFPAKPIKVGDSWPGNVDMGGQKVKITYSLAAVTTEKNNKIAIIQGKVDKGQIVKNITPIRFWVDIKNGLMERAEAKLLITTQGQDIRMEYRISRYR